MVDHMTDMRDGEAEDVAGLVIDRLAPEQGRFAVDGSGRSFCVFCWVECDEGTVHGVFHADGCVWVFAREFREATE